MGARSGRTPSRGMGRSMKRYLAPALLVVGGVILAFPLFSMTYYTMVRTSTPGFCASCHEIESAYNTWRTSSHVNNAQGLVADCMDCHIAAPQDTLSFFYTKTFHGIKDVVIHFLGGEYDQAKARAAATAGMKNQQCLKCHRNLLHLPNQRGAMLAHRTVLYPRPGYEKSCMDCHRDLVHNPRPYYGYKQYQAPYRGLGS